MKDANPSESNTEPALAGDANAARFGARDRAPQLAPTLKLSRRGLVLALGSMVAAGLLVYAMFPESIGGPELPVAVRLDKQPMETTAGNRALLTEVIVVENTADHELKKLAIEINGQYLMYNEAPLPAGDSLILPLRVFTDKRSSQRYNPTRYPVTEVVVRGQLPTAARGVSEFAFEESGEQKATELAE